MRKIFIDCGGWIGGSVSIFRESELYDLSFEIYGFEPVPELAKAYRKLDNVILYESAAWIYNGKINLYIGERSDGSSLIKEKHDVDSEHPIKVECIDFSQWILENFDKDDYIILKMDIEGAEFKVINKMIDDSSIEYINRIYVEWHPREAIPKEIHEETIKRIRYENLRHKFYSEMRMALRRKNEKNSSNYKSI